MLKKNRKKELFTVLTMALCLLLFLQRLTGEICHAILGLFLIGIMAVHLYRQHEKLMYQKVPVQLVDWMILADLAVVLLSGILLHPLREAVVFQIIHKVSSVILVIGVLVHILQHRRSK